MRLILRGALAFLALGFLAVVMAYLAGFFSQTIPPEKVDVARAPASGATIEVRSVTEPVVDQAAGTIRAKRETLISARITGSIAAVTVRAGDRAQVGDVLLELDSRELQARVEQQRNLLVAARARVSEAKPNYERIKALFERGVVPKAELDRAEAALRAAEAELSRAREAVQEAEATLSYATIRAPISGRVVERYAEPGDTATPGEPLLRLYDPETLRLEANVRETLGAGLDEGRELTARIDALNVEVPVVVDEIVPSAEPGSRTFLVKATLPRHPNLYPGMFGRLLIPTGSEERLYIPAEAVARVGQLELVTVITEQGALRRYIRTGVRTDDGRLEVLSGLMPGERIVLPSAAEK
ncbi:MAG: efflux RND transporter periplasmic adaptor subunit [Gammaproteobacteria bacterium]|nr:efflux RND transporter periplasmic adaptor subunit [Gammaproteobacteria bacterium]NIR83498.1 efflux RND transporter periplasmic adaptor subunit [Gammaproteobacteria bacterium]NIR91420.1 efflux RND transporter periplasmic adaptor subunit [Gammaproteobacteria bacterium]NIU04660.1 efflux RND transporter periplasmic adaptor subunit [Gammaproteobacteria bacterium]NIV51702.1 efflux RND transporter periplasmic adaptor subunit [Gammaproteobacteria bacterium]